MPKSIKKLYNAWGQKMKQILNEQKGVTLIALVITIIVLLILTGVTIAMLTGENGIVVNYKNSASGKQPQRVCTKKKNQKWKVN